MIHTIDYKNFIAGENPADNIPNRGFSPDSYDINLLKKPGVLYFNPAVTNRSGATLTGRLVAVCIDPLSTDLAYYVDNNGAFYSLNYDASIFTKKQTSTGYTYASAWSDILGFKTEIFATSTGAVAKLTTGMAALVEDWWSGLNNNFRHPLERVEDELFIADNNVIYYWNGTSSGTAFTLPTQFPITSLRRHPNGRTLIAFADDAGNSALGSGKGKVYYCDPVIRDWTREVVIDCPVEGSQVIGGVIYVSYKEKFGFFDGSRLVSIKTRTDFGLHSHQITNLQNHILVCDFDKVRAYGDLGNGQAWWSLAKNRDSALRIDTIISYKNKKLLYSYAEGGFAGKLMEIDFDSTGVNGVFYTNRINFDTEVHISKIEILHDVSNSAGNTIFDLYYRDIDDTETLIENISYSSQAVNKTIINCDIKTDIFQLKLVPNTDDIGYKLIRIHYEPI
ncbi:MAG: hypothetical protein KKC03_13105 [Bacteroidetes bacterium]|nr:hypothetical protein [Bacteroidota bacterium]